MIAAERQGIQFIDKMPPYPGDHEATEAERWIKDRITDPLTAKRWLLPWEPRDDYIRIFGFPIITSEAIRWLTEHPDLAGTTFIGIGSGTGYLEHEIRKAGGNAIATDPHPWQETFGKKTDLPVTRATHKQSLRILSETPNSVMILSWPENHVLWPQETVEEYDGAHLLFIGEGESDNLRSTGTKEMFKTLERNFIITDTFNLPNFTGITDDVRLYTRRTMPINGAQICS
ncbi:MAG: hypothetical protein OXC95_16095 [Dehalococcoidia bacterium]|nr:hypothetical protein [Dehalococcoidia bacterium]